jgi:hypothetical protein
MAGRPCCPKPMLKARQRERLTGRSISVFGWHLFQVIDDQALHRLFLRVELEA